MRDAIPSGRRPSGFTLIELMIVVGIIGILATVAFPIFRNFQFRSRQTERVIIVRTLAQSLDDYYNREGRFPSGTAAASFMLGNWNPDATPPSATKKAWRITGADDWRKLPFEVEGGVYYRYYAYAYVLGGNRVYQLESRGDLDGDGVLDDLMKVYQYSGSSLSKPAYDPPFRCEDCTYQIQYGSPDTF